MFKGNITYPFTFMGNLFFIRNHITYYGVIFFFATRVDFNFDGNCFEKKLEEIHPKTAYHLDESGNQPKVKGGMREPW